MVKTDNDHHGVAMAQEDPEEQVQDFRVYLPAQRVHLFARFLARTRESSLEHQQLAVFHGRDNSAPDDVYCWSYSEKIPFKEGL